MLARWLLVLSYLPFTLYDLYYSRNEPSCSHRPIQNTNIKFTLSFWLFVKGTTGFLMVVFTILVHCFQKRCYTLPLWYASFTILYSIFQLTWLIVGSIMFFGYLHKNRMCQIRFTIYMWIDLIIGLVRLSLLNCVDQQNHLNPEMIKRLRKDAHES